ncbi:MULTISPECIES: hypothetical protein, partial [unclassified Arthrobacter]|uniref:hypothetical protein n=1 Tax=unclassified Arthrobacter TaxID=235627 RepID=UPI002E119D79
CLRAMIREFPPVSILGHETHTNTGLLHGDPTSLITGNPRESLPATVVTRIPASFTSRPLKVVTSALATNARQRAAGSRGIIRFLLTSSPRGTTKNINMASIAALYGSNRAGDNLDGVFGRSGRPRWLQSK